MTTLPPPSIDADRRAPVWDAWSDLYLDTELTPEREAAIARALAGSPYSADELRDILWSEVHPVCCANLLSVAGEWQYFDQGWLKQRILERKKTLLRWPLWMLPGRKAIFDQAERILVIVSERRTGSIIATES